VTPPLAARRHSSEYAARPSRHGQGGGSNGPSPINSSLTHNDHLAGVGSVRPAAAPKPGCMAADSGTGRHAERSGAGQAAESRSAGGANADLRTPRRRRSLRWWPGASPSLTSGPFPWLCRLCSGPPAFAVNPRWGYARQKFRKIRFRFLFAGQALSFPQAGPLKVRPAICGK